MTLPLAMHACLSLSLGGIPRGEGQVEYDIHTDTSIFDAFRSEALVSC